MHEGLPSCLAKVLAGKRLLVWKRLLERYEYDDMAVFEFMTRGVPLVGIHDAPPVFLSRLNLLASPRRSLQLADETFSLAVQTGLFYSPVCNLFRVHNFVHAIYGALPKLNKLKPKSNPKQTLCRF